MKRRIAIISAAAFVAALLAGCNTPGVKESKQEAQLRWQQTRAKLSYGVAIEQFKNGQMDQALIKVQECLGLTPDDDEARLLLGKIYIGQGHFALAETELTKVAGHNPKSREAAFMLGLAQERSGHLDEALASYRRAQALDSADLQAVMAAAEVLVAMGRAAEAQAQIESYISSAGEEPGMYELSGRLAMMVGDYELAARRFATALDLDPASAGYRKALGEAQFHARRYSEAAETLRALTRLPKYAPPAWVLTMLGDCSMALDQPQEARTYYLAAKDIDPENPRRWSDLAKAALAMNDPERAVAWAQESLRREPASPEVAMVLGYALLKEGRCEKAIKALAEAVDKFPEQVVLKCLLGRAYAASGEGLKATECYAAALKIEPDNQLAKELLAAAGQSK